MIQNIFVKLGRKNFTDYIVWNFMISIPHHILFN